MSQESKRQVNDADKELQNAKTYVRSARKKFENIGDSEGTRQASEIEKKVDETREYIKKRMDG